MIENNLITDDNQLNVWLVKEGEPLPIDECPGRTMRCGILSEMLAERCNNVTWWSSDFFHQTKKRLITPSDRISIRDHLQLVLLHSNITYKKNISISRVLYSFLLGRQFRRKSSLFNRPDIIYCSFPLIDFAYEAVKYGRKNNVPVVIDIRDLWPDIIWEHFPLFLQPLVKLFCFPLIKKTNYIMKYADMIIGVMPKCMDFAKRHNRKLSINDKVYYLAYKELNINIDDKKKSVDYWLSKGLKQDDFILCWIGQISSIRTDFDLICSVIAEMPNCKLVICGDGISKKELESKYSDYTNIIFPGFLNQAELEALMSMSSIGVIPIRNTPDFIDTINNKAIEYMAGSLCIFTTLKGLLRETIENNSFGVYFENEEQFRSEISRFINDKELLHKYKSNARKYYELNFNSEIVYGDLCDEIERLALEARLS